MTGCTNLRSPHLAGDPAIRDFGLPPKSFDGNGNYTFGVTEQLMFPEIDYDRSTPPGMDITIVTTAKTNEVPFLMRSTSRSDARGSDPWRKST